MDKKKNLILTILAVLTVILITGGVTYAFFNYAKEGTTDNVITTGSITFLYTEVDGVGNGISIENAFPISDEVGKKISKTNEYFDFKITSDTTSSTSIPYEITARKSKDSNDIDQYVRVYLTKGETEEEVLLDNYNSLTQTKKVDESKYTEKTIYTAKVPSNTPDYEETFRLRMWISDAARFDKNDLNNKTFTLTVNVYANAKVVTEEEIALENNTEINTLTIEETNLTQVEGEDYDYETTLPEGTTSTTINVETENPNAKVTIEKVDSLATSNNVKRLAITKTLELTEGENLFKVTITSENKKVDDEYTIRIYVGQEGIAFRDAIFNKYEVIEDEPTLTTTSYEAGENGLYKSTLTNSGNPTYYFRGKVDNTVEFAGQTWNVIRINEDDTIRLMMREGINNGTKYDFHNYYDDYLYMYYSNANSKKKLDNWYQKTIVNKGYSTNVVSGEYFCEEAKVKHSSTLISGDAEMKLYNDPTYKPTFECNTDGNGYGIVNASVGLITYDELLYAGAYYQKDNKDFYLFTWRAFWTMSPGGAIKIDGGPYVWSNYIEGNYVYGRLDPLQLVNELELRPVLNLRADTLVVNGKNSVWKVVE